MIADWLADWLADWPAAATADDQDDVSLLIATCSIFSLAAHGHVDT